MAGMYEKHAPVIHRDSLTSSELLVVQELDNLADSGVREHLVKVSGSIVNRTDITISTTAPVGPSVNDLWIDTS